MPQLRRTFVRQRESRALETNIAELPRQLEAANWLDGAMLTGVALVSGANVINHKLGRTLRGWFVLRLRGAAAASYPVETDSDDKTLTLNFVTTATADLWVF